MPRGTSPAPKPSPKTVGRAKFAKPTDSPASRSSPANPRHPPNRGSKRSPAPNQRAPGAPADPAPPPEDSVSAEMEEILRSARMDSAAFAPSTLEPIPDDLLPDAAWVRAQGWTPLEFLVYCYRNPWVKMGDRIRAAQATLDYAHRKFSTTVQVTGADGSPFSVKTTGISLTPESLSKLTDSELDAFRVVLEKLGAPAPEGDAL